MGRPHEAVKANWNRGAGRPQRPPTARGTETDHALTRIKVDYYGDSETGSSCWATSFSADTRPGLRLANGPRETNPQAASSPPVGLAEMHPNKRPALAETGRGLG
jgi:hypothetical protein